MKNDLLLELSFLREEHWLRHCEAPLSVPAGTLKPRVKERVPQPLPFLPSHPAGWGHLASRDLGTR